MPEPRRPELKPPAWETGPAWRNQAHSGWLIAGLSVVLLLALGNLRLLSGSAAPQWDAVDFFAPSFSLVGDELHAGRLVKWNPWTVAGVPDWTEPEFGTTSPILLAASFLSINPREGYIAYWMAVWTFGGIGMLLLTRHLGAPSWGGAIAAFGFVASGFYTGHAEHMSSLYSVSFVPWVVWRLDAGLRTRDWWCGAQAGILYGLSAVGGYPAFTIMTPGFLFLWALGRVLWEDDSALPGAKRPTIRLAATLLLLTIFAGALVFCVPHAGMVAGTRGYSDHIGPRERESSISSNLLAAGALSSFASPYLADLNFPPKPLWPETDVSMTSVYTGAASLVLAIFAWRARSGWRWWVILMGVFALCCALGSQLPLRGWLYDFVPPTRYFRNPALFRAYVMLMIGVLAAMATRDLAQGRVSREGARRLWLLATLLAGSAAATFVLVSRSAGKSMPELDAGKAHLVIAWFGLAVLAYLFHVRRLSPDRFLRLVAVLAFVDACGALYTSRPTLYTSATVPWWQVMDRRHSTSLDAGSGGLARDLHPPEFLGTYGNNRSETLKIPVLDSYVTLWNRFQRQMTDDPLLSRMATGSNRLWFSPAVAWRAPDNVSFNLFRDKVHALGGQPVLVVHSPQQMAAISPERAVEPVLAASLESPDVPPGMPAEVTKLGYGPDSLSFQYVAPEHGYLLVTDRWAEGWDATVNGESRPVLGGDFIFRVVEVNAGPNVVAFTYNPRGFWPLLCISWGTLLLAAAWQCRRWVRARRNPR